MAPAYSLPVPKPNCWCGRKATLKVYNTFNAFCGDYCTEHAGEKVIELDRGHNPLNDGRVHIEGEV